MDAVEGCLLRHGPSGVAATVSVVAMIPAVTLIARDSQEMSGS